MPLIFMQCFKNGSTITFVAIMAFFETAKPNFGTKVSKCSTKISAITILSSTRVIVLKFFDLSEEKFFTFF